MIVRGWFAGALCLAGALSGAAFAQGQQLTALCSTDQGWCELAAKEFQVQTGIKVLQVHKATGEALAQLRAEAANPKTDIWWGGTGDPYLQAAEVGLLDAYRPAYLNDLHGWAVARALHQRNAADLVARALAGCGAFHHREALLALVLETEDEAHADAHLALGHALGLRRAAARVLGDVAVHLLQVLERCVFAHQLHQAREDGIARAARPRVRGFDLAFVDRVGQVGPGR